MLKLVILASPWLLPGGVPMFRTRCQLVNSHRRIEICNEYITSISLVYNKEMLCTNLLSSLVRFSTNNPVEQSRNLIRVEGTPRMLMEEVETTITYNFRSFKCPVAFWL